MTHLGIPDAHDLSTTHTSNDIYIYIYIYTEYAQCH